MKLRVDELRPNMIVHFTIDGTPHYSVIKEITNESVKLADPNLGNIELTREKFNEIYTGNALVMEAPGVVNETSNNTDAVSAQPETLADEEMESIKGQQLSVSAPVTSSMKLSAEKMQSIRGKAIWKIYAVAAGVGAGFRVANYLRDTPRNQWSLQGAGNAMFWGAVEGVVTLKALKWANKRWGRNPPRRRPPRWRWN